MKLAVDRLPFVCLTCQATNQHGFRVQCSGGDCERSFESCLSPSCFVAAIAGLTWHWLFVHRRKGKVAFSLQLPREEDDEPPPKHDHLKLVQ